MSGRLNKKEMATLEKLISMMKEVTSSYYHTLQTMMESKNKWEDNNLDIFKFTVKLEADVVNNKNIKSIKEIRVPINEFQYRSFIKISYHDKPSQLMYLTESNGKAIEELRTLMKSKEAVRETAFRTQKTSSIAWRELSIQKVYANSANERIYEKIHSMFSHSITNLVSSVPTAKTILFISVGVGNGKELTVIKENPNLMDKKIAIGGFDINSESVAIAQSAHKEGVFVEGRLQDISSCVHEIKAKLSMSSSHNSTVILIFSGVLQRSVISGTWEALQTVQQAFADTDIVLIGSLQENLITSRMAKAMGFTVEEFALRIEDLKIENSILALTKQRPEQRLVYLTKRNQKRQACFNRPVVDLSMSAILHQDLKLILENNPLVLSQAEQLDVSWSYIKSSGELESFVNFISNHMPNLKEVFIANRESWAPEFIEMLKTREVPYALRIRKDSINTAEVPETSIPNARFLRIYEQLPSDKPLFFKKSPDEKLRAQLDDVLDPNDFKVLRQILNAKKPGYATHALRQTANCIDTSKFEKTVKVADMLLRSSLEINLDDHQNSESKTTALHYAAKNNNKALYEFLRSKGANADIPNSEGRTARNIFEEKQATLELHKSDNYTQNNF